MVLVLSINNGDILDPYRHSSAILFQIVPANFFLIAALFNCRESPVTLIFHVCNLSLQRPIYGLDFAHCGLEPADFVCELSDARLRSFKLA